MLLTINIIIAVIALCVEWYIYYRLITNRPKWIRTLYIGQALSINLSVAVAMIIYRTMITDPMFMSGVVWVIWLFLLSFIVKTILALGLFVDQIYSWIAKGKHSLKGLYTGLTLAAIVVGVMLYGTIYERTTLRVEYVEIRNDKIPSQFDGYRIAQFSDAHIGNLSPWNRIIEDLVETINEIAPNIVVQTGDLVNIHSAELNEKYIDKLSEIEPEVYSVLGNHDLAYYISDTMVISPCRSIAELTNKQRAMGWNLLLNQGVWLRQGCDSIMLGGVIFPSNHHHNGYNSSAGVSDMGSALQEVKTGDFSILLAHSPSLFDSISSSAQPDLIISGHVHSMQLKLKCGDKQWSPAQWLYPMFSGLYHKNNGQQLYVNDGLGFVVIPMRFGTRPELTIFTLRSTKKRK